jgi:hypothetical protein
MSNDKLYIVKNDEGKYLRNLALSTSQKLASGTE